MEIPEYARIWWFYERFRFMILAKISEQRQTPWGYILGCMGLFCFSAGLRFWGLNRFNTLVFDEVYFANNGYNYLHQSPFFDIHPPLGKLLIALGMNLAQWMPFDPTIVTETDLWTLPTWHYRWLNAMVGSCIPLLGVAIVETLTRQRRSALLAGFLISLDGLLLVESRYSLLNIYLVFFGLLGHYFFFQAILSSPSQRSFGSRSLRLILAGIMLGACVSIKWNGLGFLLAIYGLWSIALLLRWWIGWQQQPRETSIPLFPRYLRKITAFHEKRTKLTVDGTFAPPSSHLKLIDDRLNILQRITVLRPYHLLLYFGLIPALFYRLQWIPHLQLNPQFDFWEVHRQIWGYNIRLQSGQAVHPYCSTWNTWPWLIRPVGYFFEEVKTSADALYFGLSKTVLPRIYDVHAFGNPFLWWASALAIVFLLFFTIYGCINRLKLFQSILSPAFTPSQASVQSNVELGIVLYWLVSFGANWLPWSLVSRCLYLYHHMPASIFSFCALGWCLNRGLQQSDRFWNLCSWITIVLVLFSFLYWLPIYLGLPLPPEAFHQRMWFRSWY